MDDSMSRLRQEVARTCVQNPEACMWPSLYRSSSAFIGVSIPLLGIDVGTGGTRALILSEQGRILGSASEEHVAFASPQIGWAEQDPADWWRASIIAIRKALANANLTGDDIACIGFS